MVKRKKGLISEKFILFLILIALVAIPLIRVVTMARLSETNIEVEKLQNSISEQESINESITMQINELASLDKIREYAKEAGLSYENNNIKTINKE